MARTLGGAIVPDAMPLHPAIVHVPLGLAFVLPLVALGVALARWRGKLPWRAWWGVVLLQAVVLAGCLAAVATGHADARQVAKVTGAAPVATHRILAVRFAWGAGFVLGICLLPLLVDDRRLKGPLVAAAVVGLAGTAVLAVETGIAGGRLVYRYDAARAHGARPWAPAGPGSPAPRAVTPPGDR